MPDKTTFLPLFFPFSFKLGEHVICKVLKEKEKNNPANIHMRNSTEKYMYLIIYATLQNIFLKKTPLAKS